MNAEGDMIFDDQIMSKEKTADNSFLEGFSKSQDLSYFNTQSLRSGANAFQLFQQLLV